LAIALGLSGDPATLSHRLPRLRARSLCARPPRGPRFTTVLTDHFGRGPVMRVLHARPSNPADANHNFPVTRWRGGEIFGISAPARHSQNYQSTYWYKFPTANATRSHNVKRKPSEHHQRPSCGLRRRFRHNSDDANNRHGTIQCRAAFRKLISATSPSIMNRHLGTVTAMDVSC